MQVARQARPATTASLTSARQLGVAEHGEGGEALAASRRRTDTGFSVVSGCPSSLAISRPTSNQVAMAGVHAVIQARRRAAPQQMSGRADHIIDEARRDNPIDEDRRLPAGPHRDGDAIDAAAGVGTTEQALDAKHVVPRVVGAPSTRQAASIAHRHSAAPAHRPRYTARLPSLKTRSRCCSEPERRSSSVVARASVRTANALMSSAVSCSSSAPSTLV